jgi:hypothetical protein
MKMNRRTFCAQAGITLASLTALAQKSLTPSTESRPVPMPADRADDSYAIFSLLITVLQKTTKEYLILNATENPRSSTYNERPVAETKPPMTPIQRAMSGGGVLMNVSEDRMAQFNEAVKEFTIRDGVRVKLERKFNLRLPYRLMDSKHINEYSKLFEPQCLAPVKPWHLDSKLERKYIGRGPLIRISEVYFDHARTFGLVHASSLGWNEGAGGSSCTVNWYAFEKREGTWRPATWGGYEACTIC